jgi:co-chaperonin GroES (HSP10)|tara:strand:+ start:266 stop:685 length:420 start_codon:yes stop_codon:yes gene_type:complete
VQTLAMDKAVKNDQWISNEKDIPDPSVYPNLPGYNILIRPVSVKGITKGGIFLPDSTTSDMAYLTTVGRVVAIGELAYMDETKFPKGAWCKVGDHVCYGKHTGTKLFYKGIKLLVLFDDQIMMKVEDPKDLDPTFNLSS